MIKSPEEFQQIADDVVQKLLKLEQSVASRQGVSMPADAIPYIISDLKTMRERLSFISSELFY
jgi:hypothetical protein